MGDRISLQFKDGDDLSPIICSHWGGVKFLEKAKKFAKTTTIKCVYHMIIDFIKTLDSTTDCYLVSKTENCDNDDNGHWIIDIRSGKCKS